MLEEWPREQYDYKLAHSGGEFFGFLELEDVSPESIGDYLSQPAVIQGLEQSAHAITNVDGVALSPAWLEKARSGSAALLVELRGVTNRPLELRISKNGTPVARSLFFVGAEVRFVTPSGDPKSLPVSEGNGQNEFVFNDAYPGVLSLRLEAEVSGIASSIEAQPFRFEVESIGDSLLVWDNVNQGGEASIEGNRVTAHATFEGLPTENSAFGNKQARLFLGDALLAKQSFEVFFPKNGSNHPETESDPASNWFYYWSQEIDVPNLKIHRRGCALSPESRSLHSRPSSRNRRMEIHKAVNSRGQTVNQDLPSGCEVWKPLRSSSVCFWHRPLLSNRSS